MQKIPAIYDTDNDLALAESHSILRYLCQKYNLPEQWYPHSDVAKQAKINEFMDFHHTNTRKCSYLVFHLVVAPLMKVVDPSFHEESVRKTVQGALANFEKIYLKDLNFLGGELPNIGDLLAFHDITFLELIDYDISPFAKIQKWVARMREFPYIKTANEKFEATKAYLKAQKAKQT
jgi:glutathione S-transferase